MEPDWKRFLMMCLMGLTVALVIPLLSGANRDSAISTRLRVDVRDLRERVNQFEQQVQGIETKLQSLEKRSVSGNIERRVRRLEKALIGGDTGIEIEAEDSYQPAGLLTPGLDVRWIEKSTVNYRVAAEPIDRTVRHRIQPGETISDLATMYYGSAGDWRRIWEHNSHRASGPGQLEIGMEVEIPPYPDN